MKPRPFIMQQGEAPETAMTRLYHHIRDNAPVNAGAVAALEHAKTQIKRQQTRIETLQAENAQLRQLVEAADMAQELRIIRGYLLSLLPNEVSQDAVTRLYRYVCTLTLGHKYDPSVTAQVAAIRNQQHLHLVK